MPKMKTHSGMKKRVKVTGKGKLMHEQTNRRHLFESKPSTRTRRLAGVVEVPAAYRKKVKKLLGN
jgi:large subunit ribosomal protein L35